jgi:hypothetical protein
MVTCKGAQTILGLYRERNKDIFNNPCLYKTSVIIERK